jgi:Ca2+-binding RTX toxin-like protein
VTIRFASAVRTLGGAVSQLVLSGPTWSTTLALAEETGAGAFAIQSVTLADTLGNAATLTAAALAAGGWPTTFTVLAPAVTPPDDGGSGDPGDEDPGDENPSDDDPGTDGPQEIVGTDGDDRIVCGPDGASVDAGAGDDSVTGGAGADTVSAGDGADTVRGNEGDDIVDGDDGDDAVDGGAGSDELYGGPGNDTLAGADGADTLAGDDGADLLVGGAGNDRLEGDGGADTLDPGAGDDVAIGGAGVDTIRYLGAAAVSINLSLSSAQRTIGAGVDRILSIENAATGSGGDRIVGSRGANLLSAGAGDDQLGGGAGNDTLLGGDGRDTLEGDAGRDVLTGGGGADRFVFDFAAGSTRTVRDRITDFRRSLDKIDLSAIDAAPEPGDQAFRFRGSRSFTGEEGELRFAAGVLSGDLDGDRVADLAIQISGVGRLTAADLLL